MPKTGDLSVSEAAPKSIDEMPDADEFYQELGQIISDAYFDFEWGEDEASESSGEQSSENSR